MIHEQDGLKVREVRRMVARSIPETHEKVDDAFEWGADMVVIHRQVEKR